VIASEIVVSHEGIRRSTDASIPYGVVSSRFAILLPSVFAPVGAGPRHPLSRKISLSNVKFARCVVPIEASDTQQKLMFWLALGDINIVDVKPLFSRLYSPINKR